MPPQNDMNGFRYYIENPLAPQVDSFLDSAVIIPLSFTYLIGNQDFCPQGGLSRGNAPLTVIRTGGVYAGRTENFWKERR